MLVIGGILWLFFMSTLLQTWFYLAQFNSLLLNIKNKPHNCKVNNDLFNNNTKKEILKITHLFEDKKKFYSENRTWLIF